MWVRAELYPGYQRGHVDSSEGLLGSSVDIGEKGWLGF